MAYAAPVNRPGLIGNGIKSIGNGNRVIMTGKIMSSVKLLLCIFRGELRVKLQQRIVQKTIHEIRRRKGIIAIELFGVGSEVIIHDAVICGFKRILRKRKNLKSGVIAKIWSYAGRCISQNIR